MSARICGTPGCPTPIPKDARGGRCSACRSALEAQRGSRIDRGYDAAHVAQRADYQRRMDDGETFDCWRCGHPIDPQTWQLGHCDTDRAIYHGPECTPCNSATSGRHGTPCPHPSHISPDA